MAYASSGWIARQLRNGGRAGLVAALACLLLAGCAEQKAPEPLRVGTVSWPGIEFAFLAVEKGLFRQEGVDVKLVDFAALQDARRAYERGQLDGVFSTVTEVLQADQQTGRLPKITMVTDFSNGADIILAAPAIKSVRALKGKRVGLELGTINGYVLARALEKAGLEIGDVHLVNLAQAQMARAFANKEIDAVVTFPPYSLPLIETAKMQTIFTSAEIPGELVSVLFFDRQVLQERPRDVAAFMRAFGNARAYVKQHPEESYHFMAAKEHISVDEFKAAISEGITLVGPSEQTPFFAPSGKLDTAVNVSTKVLLATGQLRKPVVAADVIARPSGL